MITRKEAMKKLLIATSNPGKLKEITKTLADLPLKLLTLKDLGILDEMVEDGKTFEENAIKKAEFYCQKSSLPTIADDGGLEIDILGGEPGVKSRRWINDKESSDDELIVYTLKKLKDVPLEKRGAQLRAVLALAFSNGEVFTSEGKIRGIIAEKVSKYRFPGFPFRSLLFIPELKKYYNYKELTLEEEQQYNHRGKAIKKLKKIIKNRFLK